MWVKPDGNGQKMVVQLNNSYEAYLTEFVKGTKAQYVTIPFSSFVKKGTTDESVDKSSITSFYLWCNSVPDNYSGQKDEDGNYTVTGTILFDDIKAVKISDADLAKANAQGLIISDKALTNLLDATPGGDTPGGDTPGGDTPGGATPGGDTPGSDIPGGDTPGDATPGGDTPDGNQNQGGDQNQNVKVTAPGKINFASVKRESESSQKAVLKWKQASDASGYEIYMKTGKNGTYKLTKTISDNSKVTFTTAKLKKDVTYYFKIRGYKTVSGQTAYGEYSAEKKITFVSAPQNTSFTSVKKAKSQKAVLKWKKAAGATGYEIYMKAGKKGEYKLVKKVTRDGTTSYTTNKLKKNTKYYFKIRSYKTISGETAYGKYSKEKSITIK